MLDSALFVAAGVNLIEVELLFLKVLGGLGAVGSAWALRLGV
jgi:hypothetical protein